MGGQVDGEQQEAGLDASDEEGGHDDKEEQARQGWKLTAARGRRQRRCLHCHRLRGGRRWESAGFLYMGHRPGGQKRTPPPEAKEDPGQLRGPGRRGPAGHKRLLQPLNHPIGLRMSGCDVLNAKGATGGGPGGGS